MYLWGLGGGNVYSNETAVKWPRCVSVTFTDVPHKKKIVGRNGYFRSIIYSIEFPARKHQENVKNIKYRIGREELTRRKIGGI